MDNKARITHLQELLNTIKRSERYESDFDRLYELLKTEYHSTGGSNVERDMGSYNHNLEQTIDKQAQSYIDARSRKKRGAFDEYQSFVYHFGRDVEDELQHLEFAEKSKE